VYTDNGTNFVDTHNALQALDRDKITEEQRFIQIRWKFNPPATPCRGGFWERMLRMVMELLRRSLGRSKIGFEKLSTCIYEIAAIINKRPLCVVNEVSEGPFPLTPGMFLSEIEYLYIADRELLKKENLLKFCKYKQTFMDELKARFRKG